MHKGGTVHSYIFLTEVQSDRQRAALQRTECPYVRGPRSSVLRAAHQRIDQRITLASIIYLRKIHFCFQGKVSLPTFCSHRAPGERTGSWGGSSHQSHPHGLSFLSVNSRSCEDRMICTGHRACHVARHSLSFYSKSNLTLPEPHKIMTKR